MSRVQPISLFRSHAVRVALAQALIFGFAVLVLLGFLYWATAGYLAAQSDATINAEIEGLADQYRERGLDGLTQIIAERMKRDPRGDSVYLFATSSFQALAGNLSQWPDAPIELDGWVDFSRDVHGERRRTRARAFILSGGVRLLVGRDVQALQAVRDLVTRALGWGLALAVGLATLVGISAARVTVRRIEAINTTSAEIMAGDLSRRVPSGDTGDDFDQLSDNLNAMLDEIETLMASVRDVSDSVAHDLRTPLTRLRHRLEELHARLDSTNAGAAGLAELAIGDVDQLLGTFKALLRIARLDSGQVERAFEPLDLGQLARDAFELYEAVAADAGVELRRRLGAGCVAKADRDLVFQALVNLIDNALKFTPVDGVVTLEVMRRDGQVCVAVADTGVGVESSAHDRIFQRFYRGERSRTTPGSGLGLSLVAAIARHHDAKINVYNNEPGLTVELRLPAHEVPTD